ncbi:DUF305 domain-containing protein [Amycolatopsis nigrescens]|uniref:DUF305 domain-containing protein n=1 Tax=Amycolatopsis nigrescens TaxID=381445 RepID=UPI000371BC19|nr:DUF305 domain-containing protein [Amycolatopsis nigrescens]
MKRYSLVLLTAGLLLAGCGSGQHSAHHPPGHGAHPEPAPAAASAPGAAGEFNPADVMFLQMAIIHHNQGVEIAKLAKSHDTRKEVSELAAAIEVTQLSEVGTMTDWLRRWNQPVETSMDPNSHAEHGGLPLTSPDQIAELAATTGAEFETRFLSMLTGHQHGAVEMAQHEAKDGASPDAKGLANRIVESRTAQIQQMLTLMDR